MTFEVILYFMKNLHILNVSCHKSHRVLGFLCVRCRKTKVFNNEFMFKNLNVKPVSKKIRIGLNNDIKRCFDVFRIIVQQLNVFSEARLVLKICKIL